MPIENQHISKSRFPFSSDFAQILCPLICSNVLYMDCPICFLHQFAQLMLQWSAPLREDQGKSMHFMFNIFPLKNLELVKFHKNVFINAWRQILIFKHSDVRYSIYNFNSLTLLTVLDVSQKFAKFLQIYLSHLFPWQLRAQRRRSWHNRCHWTVGQLGTSGSLWDQVGTTGSLWDHWAVPSGTSAGTSEHHLPTTTSPCPDGGPACPLVLSSSPPSPPAAPFSRSHGAGAGCDCLRQPRRLANIGRSSPWQRASRRCGSRTAAARSWTQARSRSAPPIWLIIHIYYML